MQFPETPNDSRGFRATAGSGGTSEIIGLLVAVGSSPVDILVAMAGDDNPGVINVAGGGRKAVVIEGWAAALAAVRSMADRGSPNKGERDGGPCKGDLDEVAARGFKPR